MSDRRVGTTVALPGVSDLKAIQMLQTYPQWMDQIWQSNALSEGLILALSQTANIPSDLADIMHSYGLTSIEFIREYYQLCIRIQSGGDLESAKEELRDLWNRYRSQIPIAHFFAKYLNTTVAQVLLGLDRKDRSITRLKDRTAKLLEYQVLPTYLETTESILSPWTEMDHPLALKIIGQMQAEGIPSDVYAYRLEILGLLDSANLPELYPKLLEITNQRFQKWFEGGYLKKALLEITEFEDVLDHILKESGLTYSRLTELLASLKDLEQLRPYMHVLRVMEAVEERFKPRFEQISIEIQLKMFLRNELTGADLAWLRDLVFTEESGVDRLRRLRMSDEEVIDKLVEYWNTKQTIRDEMSLGEAKSEEDSALTEKFAGKIVNFVVFRPLSLLKLFTELYDWICIHVSDIGIEIRALRDQYRRIMQIGKAIGLLVKEIQLVFPDMDSHQVRSILHFVFMGEQYEEVLQKLPSTPSALTRVIFREEGSFKSYPNLLVTHGWWPVALETLIQYEEKVKQIGTDRLAEKTDDFDPAKAYSSVASNLSKQLSSLSAQASAGASQTFVFPGHDAGFAINKTLNPLVEIERRTRVNPTEVFLQMLEAEISMPMGTQTIKQIIQHDIFGNDAEQCALFIRGLSTQSHILDMCDYFSSELVGALIRRMLPHADRLGLENNLVNVTNEYISLLRQMRNSLRGSESQEVWGRTMASLIRFSEQVEQILERTNQFRNTSLVQLANYIIHPSKLLLNVLNDLGFGRKGIIREYVERTLKETIVLQRLLRHFRLGQPIPKRDTSRIY